MKKLICSMMAAIVFLLSPLSAFASTTESMLMYANTRSIPTNYGLSFSTIVRNDNSILSGNTVNISDDSSSDFSSFISDVSFTNIDDLSVGYRFSFTPYSPNFYNSVSVDLSSMGLRLMPYSNGAWCVLSPFAVSSDSYVVITGRYDYQIYDGSVNYKRWLYDNPFSIIKPLSVVTSEFGQEYYKSNGFYDNKHYNGYSLSISYEFLKESDILNVAEYANDIYGYNDYSEGSQIDYVTGSMRFGIDSVDMYVLFPVNHDNFINYDTGDYVNFVQDVSYYVRGNFYTSPYNNDTTYVDVNFNSNRYDNSISMFANLSSSVSYLVSRVGSGLSDVVTNATENANRIIQNTTNKINEVKEGVTEVKDSVIETKNSILDLPNKIKDMLLGLIVPSSETMSNKFSEFSELLEEKLGIIYQVPMMLFDFFDTIVNAATTPQTTLTLPAFQLPWIDGSTLTVWQPMEYKIIPEGMQVLSDLIKTITSMTVVVLTFNSVKRAYERFLRS